MSEQQGLEPSERRPHAFEVHLDVFEGPFDVLLGLVAKRRLDVTEVALHEVTDEFIAYIGAHEAEWSLDEASRFLVVAATLLDLKSARLLPGGSVDDEEDLELLEARDLLLARLLQYRAYKQVAGVLSRWMADASRRFGRSAGPDPGLADLRPAVELGATPEQLAALAARALTPDPSPAVPVEHLYTPLADVREQAGILADRLRRVPAATFGSLVADAAGTYEVVARFLALLELYRDGVVAFEQAVALGELHVRWVGAEQVVEVGDDYSGRQDDQRPEPAERVDGARNE